MVSSKHVKKAGLWDKSVIEAVKMVDGDLNLLNGTLPENIKKQFCTAFDQDQFQAYRLCCCSSKNG